MSQIDHPPVLKTFFVRSAAIFGFAFLALFVQTAQAQGPLNYFKNYFVTGDYVVGGVGLSKATVTSLQGSTPPSISVTSSIALDSVPCTSGPGLFARVVPCAEKGAAPADIIAAFLYWQTIESTPAPYSAYGSFDATFPANPFVGLALGNSQISACAAGGGTSGPYMRVYRADVLKYLPINNTANVRLANGTQTFTLVSADTKTQFVGATLVVVYRLVAPGNPKIAPLRSVVLYDGAFTGTASSGLNQTMGGFYQASPDADAKMTHIVGNGQSISNRKEKQTLLVNGGIPDGVPSDPFEGTRDENWENYTFNYDLAPNASSVNTQVVLQDDCLSWGAIITSTKVQDSDFDGLLDVWEKSGLYFDPGVRNDGTTTPPVPATFGTCANNSPGCVNLPAMGANPFVPDIFMQIDWMQSTGSAVPPHVHLPQLAALNMVGDAFKSHGINLHFDVGNNYQTPQSPYIIPATYAQGGNVIPESGNLLCPNSKTSICAFPQQESDYSLLGWKSGLDAIKNGDSVLGLLPLFAANRKDTFHYALFAHGIAATTPLSNPLAGSISGVGDLPGGDLMVTLGLWRSDIPAVDQVGTVLEQAGTLMHELGHNLDLKHGGWNDTPVCKPDYPSVMNYLYQVDGLTDSSGNEHIDYSRGLELPMSEDFLSSFFPMGLQQYRVRYFGPFNSATNTPGQPSQVSCNGQLPSSFGTTEGPYVRLEGPAVSTPDWSNGTILPLGKIITSGLDINYDGTIGQTFFDSPDWISLNLQQVGARPNANGLSLNVGISDIGISDIGISDIGISDIGISDIGISDIGISDIGISDIGTAQLGQDALGDQDFASYVLSGVNPPTLLTATVYVPSTTGGTGNLLNWTPPTAGQVLQYNIYRCNASGVACTPSSPALTNVPGGTATPTFTDTVNDFVDAGTTCPAARTCYNTAYNYYVTAVVTAVGKNVESGPSNTVSGEVNHLFVIANISPQTVVYGSANPAITPNIYGNSSVPLTASQVTCVYSPATPRNASATPYPIVCSGPATTSTTDGVTYNANYLSYTPSTLTITPRPITVTAVASSKFYDGTPAATVTLADNRISPNDTFTDSYSSASFSDPNPGVGKTVTVIGISINGTGATNYTLTSTTATTTANISDAIDLSALSKNGVNYGSSAQAPPIWTGTALQLTNTTSETASAWLGTAIPVASAFTTTFRFQITPSSTGPIGDGFAFVIQGAQTGAATLGATGQGMYIGYDGIPNSIAIEFDTYQNGQYGDPTGAHIGIQSLGIQPNTPDHTNASANLGGPVQVSFADGKVHTATITYDGSSIVSVYLDGSATPVVSGTVTDGLNTFLGLNSGTAYVGFTAATGAAQEYSDILAWTWN